MLFYFLLEEFISMHVHASKIIIEIKLSFKNNLSKSAIDLGAVSFERFKRDSDKWRTEVESLIGPTDILIYPFGADVGDWRPYAESNERYQYLYSLGFRYFCNVDSNPYWVQLGDQYLRQGRRNLDGYRMWKDMTATDPANRKLDDLFRAEDVFDAGRPTPVGDM